MRLRTELLIAGGGTSKGIWSPLALGCIVITLLRNWRPGFQWSWQFHVGPRRWRIWQVFTRVASISLVVKWQGPDGLSLGRSVRHGGSIGQYANCQMQGLPHRSNADECSRWARWGRDAVHGAAAEPFSSREPEGVLVTRLAGIEGETGPGAGVARRRSQSWRWRRSSGRSGHGVASAAEGRDRRAGRKV